MSVPTHVAAYADVARHVWREQGLEEPEVQTVHKRQAKICDRKRHSYHHDASGEI